MEEALARKEYPAMLERLPPALAVTTFKDRVNTIGNVNTEIADWLAERRKAEDTYVLALKKLSKKPLQISGSLGILEAPWKRIVKSTETIANSHATLSQNIEKSVEQPLRSFASTNAEMSTMLTIHGNLSNMAKQLDEAKNKSDKLNKKGGKVDSQKVDTATAKLQTASQQWDTQSPFVFEKLQSVDETRLNHIRDVLTQYETFESDHIDRSRKSVEGTLPSLLEMDTALEIKNWSQSIVAGRPLIERSAGSGGHGGSRGGSVAGASIAGSGPAPAPPTPRSTHTDSGEQEEKAESKFSRSRFGTMLKGRRQSVQGGFNRAPSPSKGSGFTQFGRNSGSRDGRPNPSPRASSTNMREDAMRDNRLSSLAESPTATSPTSPNGMSSAHAGSSLISDAIPEWSSNAPNGSASSALADLSDVQPPPGPPPSHLRAAENAKDAEGFSVPGVMNDPISQAQQEAAHEAAQSQFKLDIQKEPIQEQDADAQAALSNVSNTLRSATLAPGRKVGTVRGRRDVRNTVFVPNTSSRDFASPEPHMPPSPGIAAGRAATLAALSSTEQAPSASDSTSIRSGHSLAHNLTVKHAEMHQPGLNASIVEILHASSENGETKSLKINGEISLVFNRTPGEDLTSESEIVRVNNFPNLEAIGEDRTFIHSTSDERPDEFNVALASISPKPAIGFNYRVHIDEASLGSRNPLIIKPAWKPSAGKLDFVIEYGLNPAYGTEPVTFHNFGIIARYSGGRPTECKNKPSGVFAPHQSCVYWRFAEVTLTVELKKIVCRLVAPEGDLPTPGLIDAKWEMQGSVSGLSLSRFVPNKGKEKEESDPFADDSIASPSAATQSGTWVDVETISKLVSGKYDAQGLTAQ